MLTSPNRNISQTAQPTFPNSLVSHIWVEEQESNKNISWKAFSRQIWSSMHSWKLNNLLPKYLLMLPKKKKIKIYESQLLQHCPHSRSHWMLTNYMHLCALWRLKKAAMLLKKKKKKKTVLLCCFLVLVFPLPPPNLHTIQKQNKAPLHNLTQQE